MEVNHTLKVNVSKEFAVSKEQLFEAWNKPELLKQWWKPMNNTLTDVTNELKEGGNIKYVFSGNDLTITGNYLAVKEPERLVYTWNWEFEKDSVKNGAYKLTVEFAGNDNNGSSITITQENFKNEEGTLPHQEGWNKGLEDLKQFLENNAQSNAAPLAYEDPSGGYNESPEQVKVGGG